MASGLYCIVIFLPILCAASADCAADSELSLLQVSLTQSRSSTDSSQGFRYSPTDPAAQTLLNIDKNLDGRIAPDEIGAFARAQGMDAAAATKEFASIDVNRDGFLDSEELRLALGTAGSAEQSAAKKSTAAQTSPTQTAQTASISGDASTETVSTETVSAKIPGKPASIAAAESKSAIVSDKARESVMAATQLITEQLSLEGTEERKARELDLEAANLHANSSALVESVVKHAMEDSAKAASEKTSTLLAEVQEIERQAERAAEKAAALNAKAKLEMDEANELVHVANGALSR